MQISRQNKATDRKPVGTSTKQKKRFHGNLCEFSHANIQFRFCFCVTFEKCFANDCVIMAKLCRFSFNNSSLISKNQLTPFADP